MARGPVEEYVLGRSLLLPYVQHPPPKPLVAFAAMGPTRHDECPQSPVVSNLALRGHGRFQLRVDSGDLAVK